MFLWLARPQEAGRVRLLRRVCYVLPVRLGVVSEVQWPRVYDGLYQAREDLGGRGAAGGSCRARLHAGTRRGMTTRALSPGCRITRYTFTVWDRGEWGREELTIEEAPQRDGSILARAASHGDGARVKGAQQSAAKIIWSPFVPTRTSPPRPAFADPRRG